MPRKRPVHRVRRWTDLQLTQLTLPYIASNIPAFVDDAERRECWEQNRERLMAATAPDKPNGWLMYENPDLEERAAYLHSARGGLEK